VKQPCSGRFFPHSADSLNADDFGELARDEITVMAMSTNVENLILARLDRIRDELAVIRVDVGEIKLDIRELRARTGQLEHAVTTLSMRTDRLYDRVERIDVRLGLADAPGQEPSPMPS
jgi:chromosome segregation ATPase